MLQELSSSYSVAGEWHSSVWILLLKRRVSQCKACHRWAAIFHRSKDCQRNRDNRRLLLLHLLEVGGEGATSQPGIKSGQSMHRQPTCCIQIDLNLLVGHKLIVWSKRKVHSHYTSILNAHYLCPQILEEHGVEAPTLEFIKYNKFKPPLHCILCNGQQY